MDDFKEVEMKFVINGLLLVAILCCAPVLADNPKKIRVIGYAPHPAIERHYLHIIKQSYANIGLNPDFVPISDKRSIRMLSENKLDGLVVRTENIIQNNPNFIPVPPALGIVEITLICQKEFICDTKLFDNPDRSLGLVAQEEYYQELLKGKTINIYEVGDYKRMQLMFEQKKLDVIIMVFDLNTRNSKSIPSNTYTLTKRKGFHMIHKKFDYLVPSLSESLTKVLEGHKFNNAF